MFGLENQKKKKYSEFVFDLEKELRDPNKHREIQQHVEQKIQRIKEILRAGQDKEEFDVFGTLLHGYTSLLKIMARFKKLK